MHLSASIPKFFIQEHFPYWQLIPGHVEVLKNPFEPTIKYGVMPISDASGFGVTLRQKELVDCLYGIVNLS